MDEQYNDALQEVITAHAQDIINNPNSYLFWDNGNPRHIRLAYALAHICNGRAADIAASVDYRGPRGGSNARILRGWVRLGIGTITRAINHAHVDVPTANWWDGSLPTPSTAIPAVVAPAARLLYAALYLDAEQAARYLAYYS